MLRPSLVRHHGLRAAFGLAVLVVVVTCSGADGNVNPWVERGLQLAKQTGAKIAAWYWATPPAERIPSAGLVACGVLGGLTLLDRMFRLRRRRVMPNDFMKRFKDRMDDVKLERGKILDLCELNSSPASRVALAAVKRWGRSTLDLERGVSIATRVEADRLKRNVGTLRRIAAMAPLLGLLGSLLAAGRAFATGGNDWAPAMATALAPVTAGVAMAILSLVAYDGLMGRVEKLVGNLERLGAETIDAISMAAPPEPPRTAHPQPSEPPQRRHSHGPSGPARTPHQYRVDIPNAIARAMEHDEDLYDL